MSFQKCFLFFFFFSLPFIKSIKCFAIQNEKMKMGSLHLSLSKTNEDAEEEDACAAKGNIFVTYENDLLLSAPINISIESINQQLFSISLINAIYFDLLRQRGEPKRNIVLVFLLLTACNLTLFSWKVYTDRQVYAYVYVLAKFKVRFIYLLWDFLIILLLFFFVLFLLNVIWVGSLRRCGLFLYV